MSTWFFSFAASALLASLSDGSGVTTIEHVTVIRTSASAAKAQLHDQTIVVEGGVIVHVGHAGTTDVPSGASRIDARGAYVIPGLWDMHVHLSRFGHMLDGSLELLLANGVTGVRNMRSDVWPGVAGVTIEEMRALQAALERGEVAGPRLLALAGVTVRGPRRRLDYPMAFPETWQPRTRAAGRDLVTFLAGRGADFIKVYSSVPREGFLGMMEEARRRGIPVAGHLPWAVHPVEAARAGMRSIEHARFPAYACTRHWEPFRRAFDPYAAMESDEWPEALFRKANVRAVDDFDAVLADSIFRAFVTHDVYLCPTHVTRQVEARAADSGLRQDPKRRYVSEEVLARWDRDLDGMAGEGDDVLARHSRFFEHGLRVTGLAHAAGVPIMAGTDANDTCVFPGFSLHDELELLARAGLTPFEVLRSATVVPSAYLGRRDRYGDVSAGKAADLVLLDADPLADIGNTRAIAAVMIGGRWHDRAALDALLEGVAR